MFTRLPLLDAGLDHPEVAGRVSRVGGQWLDASALDLSAIIHILLERSCCLSLSTIVQSARNVLLNAAMFRELGRQLAWVWRNPGLPLRFCESD